MAGRSFNVADLDFDAITDEIGKLVAPRVSLEEVLAKVRDQMVAQKKKGRVGGADEGGVQQARHRGLRACAEGVYREGGASGS